MAYVVLVLAYCAGASVIMWLAEKINEKGIGNGISIILFANIIARLPAMAGSIWSRCFTRWNIFVEKEVENWKAIQIPVGIVCLLLFLAKKPLIFAESVTYSAVTFVTYGICNSLTVTSLI